MATITQLNFKKTDIIFKCEITSAKELSQEEKKELKKNIYKMILNNYSNYIYDSDYILENDNEFNFYNIVLTTYHFETNKYFYIKLAYIK